MRKIKSSIEKKYRKTLTLNEHHFPKWSATKQLSLACWWTWLCERTAAGIDTRSIPELGDTVWQGQGPVCHSDCLYGSSDMQSWTADSKGAVMHPRLQNKNNEREVVPYTGFVFLCNIYRPIYAGKEVTVYCSPNVVYRIWACVGISPRMYVNS